ncbi:DUF1499 domain-containing protein [Roseobacter litoralis]|uniref:DUF1499 domain-containing protein n=1 Tax=Roseobacter litoralis (strain ATCC 49566 / DSM 6996 / JCM 21268 / NBRC 15278 / OCh 149) TaxID=391595 RepID=F7ZBE2_ROSLO|nr:DUF1499 domain-containing protein [Roseobacter litoralis]AEI94328.1 hypothetical protein RLO149_c023580 [Roseobacter litoralis Och 149]
MRMFLGFGLIIVVCALAYVRLSQGDISNWHVPVAGTQDADGAGDALRVIAATPETFAAADAYMAALPRTKALAGSLDEGRITYITRSQVFGFPDYTTVEYADGTLKAFARLRYGQSDLGVNRERLEGLIAALQ